MSEQIKVGITHGDINGVGYEILLKTFADERLQELFVPVIYGSPKSASYHRKVLNYSPINFHIINYADDCSFGKINLLNCVKEEVKIELGTATTKAGESAFIALDNAARDLAAKKLMFWSRCPSIKIPYKTINSISRDIPSFCRTGLQKATRR